MLLTAMMAQAPSALTREGKSIEGAFSRVRMNRRWLHLKKAKQIGHLCLGCGKVMENYFLTACPGLMHVCLLPQGQESQEHPGE